MMKPWKKVSKEDKLAYAKHKMVKGLGVFVFGIVWMYFSARAGDVWDALPMTLVVIGLLLFLLGLYKKHSV